MNNRSFSSELLSAIALQSVARTAGIQDWIAAPESAGGTWRSGKATS